MNPRTVCRCQPMVFMISEMVAPVARCSMATTWAVLLPSRGAAAASRPSRAFAAVLPLGAFLAGVAFLAALPLSGAPLADCAPRLAGCTPPLAFPSAFGFAGWSAFGSGSLAGVAADLLAGAPAVVPPFWVTGSPSPCMRAHTRLMAVLRSVNFFTGVTPGRLFQTARSLSAGHWAARSANSCWLAKESNGVAVAAAASSWVANALMLLSLSMVNVFIWVLSWHGVAVTLTFITLVGQTGKGNLTEVREWLRTGDEVADMAARGGSTYRIGRQDVTISPGAHSGNNLIAHSVWLTAAVDAETDLPSGVRVYLLNQLIM